MAKRICLSTIFDNCHIESSHSMIYEEQVLKILERGLPKKMQNRESFTSDLPCIVSHQWESNPQNFSICLICRHRQNAARFFNEMISRWLIPGKQLHLDLSFSMNFRLPDFGDELYTACELVLSLDNVQDIALVKRNLPFLEREIRMGAVSFYHASKILEMKGLTLDDKTALIHEKIAQFLKRFPKKFDRDIFAEMQHFLISSKELFKVVHSASQMGRIIANLYLFRKEIEKDLANLPSKRHLRLKLKKTLLNTPFGLKEVLSIFVGLNFLKEHELFEERHFLSALSHFIPGVQSIPDSYFCYENPDENIQTFYLEMEKEEGRAFSDKELKKLREGLPAEIHSRIEQLVPPIFMPRNEEEVMRNILVLSHQLKFIKDLPHMIISFDEQTDLELSFTVIIVRILQPDDLQLKELFSDSPLSENLSIDRVKMVGRLRRKYPKEASVMRVRLPVEDFLREDYSVDLFRARLKLVREIQSVIGEVRDYNGGMISKQNENFLELKALVGKLAGKHALLLQNFFHSIFPVHMSTTLEPALLKVLFLLLLESIENQESILYKSKKANDHLFVMIKFQDLSWKQKIFGCIEGLKLPSSQLMTIQMQIFDSFYLGFTYLNADREKQKEFLEAIPEALSCSV